MKSVKPTDNIEYKNLQHFTVVFKKIWNQFYQTRNTKKEI